MATNKKPRKKYNPNKCKRQLEVLRLQLPKMFAPLFLFFQQLKNGTTETMSVNEYKNMPSIKFMGEYYPAYMVLQKWCVFIDYTLINKNINLDYSPLIEFARLLVERNNNLYFESYEIQQAKDFVEKVHNIFIKEVTREDLYNARLNLDIGELLLENGDLQKDPFEMKYQL